MLIYPVDDAALVASQRQEYLQLFTILKPGGLKAQLELELPKLGRVKLAEGGGLLAGLRREELFGPADAQATYGYAERISKRGSEFERPFQAFEMQQQIWLAWLPSRASYRGA